VRTAPAVRSGDEIDRMARSTTQHVGVSREAAQELSAVSTRLREMVGGFRS
jgi:hypothetical protein